jgi:hypothetical protein
MLPGSDDRDAGVEGDAELASISDAIRILQSSPDDLVLSADYKDVVYAALLEFEHAWRGDHWWTPSGDFRTLGELRALQRRIEAGDWPDSGRHAGPEGS